MKHAEVIAALGGQEAVARLLGVHRTRPGRWARDEGIPPRHWPRLINRARELDAGGVTLEALEAGSPFRAEGSGGDAEAGVHA